MKTPRLAIAALLCVVFTAKVRAQLPNAWQINDNSTASGSYFAYFTNLNTEQFDGATTNGWRFTITSRLLTDYGGANGSIYFIYGNGTRRYGINLLLNAGSQLIVTPLGGSAITLTTAAGAGTNYHNHQLVYDPATGNVTYRFDGTPKVTWSGQASSGQSHEVVWGSDSSSDRGEMNFNRVDFEVFGQGVVATYDAGFAGNPAVAPDPLAQGWALSGSTSLVSAGPVSPDGVGLTQLFGDAVADLPGLSFGSVSAGDYDNDGRLDLLVIGYATNTVRVSQVWRNTGNGFTNINAGLPGINNSEAVWGDYDNDGRLDILLAGQVGSTFTAGVWRNTGNGFTNINVGLPGVDYASVDWGDYDRDGRLDILISGQTTNSEYITEIWRNTGTGFTNINAGITPVYRGSARWCDYDNDGRLDVAIGGITATLQSVTEIWRNTGNGFVNINAGLPGCTAGSLAWGDYDNDGHPDLLITGSTNIGSTGLSMEIMRNEGSGFTNAGVAFPNLFLSSAAWGDYDNDGRFDIVLLGATNAFGGVTTELWRNTNSGFAKEPLPAPGLARSAVAWGDFNGDGRLDFVTTGTTTNVASAGVSQLWLNLWPTPDTRPEPPTGLTLVSTNSGVQLQWNRATDNETPSAALTCNLRIGTSPGASDVLDPMADSNGLRRIVKSGNMWEATNVLLNLPSGTYYWSVQSVDSAFVGSAFAPEQNFSVSVPPIATTLPATDVEPLTAILHGTVNPRGLPTAAWFEYGSDTNYGSVVSASILPATNVDISQSDAVSGLAPGQVYHYRLVASNSVAVIAGADGSFTTPLFYTLNPGLGYGGGVWGDYDNDGRLDIFIAGFDGYPAYNPSSQLWRNTELGLTNVNTGLPAALYNSLAWADYDNDGRLDLAIAGYDSPNDICEVWRNTGSGFANINAGLPGLQYSTIAWGDYNNDGRPDILLMGYDATGITNVSGIWSNTGAGFTNINAGLPQLNSTHSAAWGDYDNDGRLDFVLAGYDGTNDSCEIWRNTGAGFTSINAGLPGIESGGVAWGDYDNDGRFLDLALDGYDGTNDICEIWRNTGSGFTNINANLPGFEGTIAWGDYDNDGRLDVLLAGYTANGYITQVWLNTGNGFTNLNLNLGANNYAASFGDLNNDGRLDILTLNASGDAVWINTEINSNTVPSAPTGLAATVVNGQVEFHWNAATDAQTPSAGLSYNLRVGTTPGGGDIVSPEANSDGFRLLPAPGNAQMRTNAILAGLNPGNTYYWSVQAVDTSFAGGPFASEASFVMPGPTLSIVATNANAVISWQPSYLGVVLQESPSLNPAAWTNSPSGATNPIVVPATNTTMFYRLFKP